MIKEYDPLKAGSIDGTDTIPHDKAICRAISSSYKPPSNCSNEDSKYTLFISRLSHSVTEEELYKKFSKIGELKYCKLITDIVTGTSKGYGFIEYKRERDSISAYHDMDGFNFHGKPILVDWKVSSSLPGWIPRRLGGGWGGKKESGQLRFGCRDRPWHRPIILPYMKSKSSERSDRKANRKQKH